MISDAESAVMELLWARSPLSADEVVAALTQSRDWQDATVKTLLNRLLNKGAISARKDGRRYLYSAELAREDWSLQQSTSVLDRCFGGRVAPLVAQFGAQGKLSPQDIAELRKLIAELGDDN